MRERLSRFSPRSPGRRKQSARQRDGEKLIGSEYIGEEAPPSSQNQITGAFDTLQDDIKQLSRMSVLSSMPPKVMAVRIKDGVQHAREPALSSSWLSSLMPSGDW